jgi:hypothetical protein
MIPSSPSPPARRAEEDHFGVNLSLDGYIAAPGDDLGWSVPSDELFQWWSDRVGATGLALYGRKLWETMSSHWPTADLQPGATPAQIEFARRWRTCRMWCSPRRPARSTGALTHGGSIRTPHGQ